MAWTTRTPPFGVVDAVPAGPEVSVASARPSGPIPGPTPEPVPDRAPATTDAMLTVPTAGPARVVIPVLSVTSDVVDVGLEPDGALEIPEDVRTVGWYVPASGRTVLPGAAGTAVLAGHVDSRVQGPGVFNRIRTLRPGNAVVVVHDDGSETVWQVDEVIRYPKADVPIADIFLFEGEPRLALITCGGDFDRASGSYLDNYVVLASRSG